MEAFSGEISRSLPVAQHFAELLRPRLRSPARRQFILVFLRVLVV